MFTHARGAVGTATIAAQSGRPACPACLFAVRSRGGWGWSRRLLCRASLPFDELWINGCTQQAACTRVAGGGLRVC